LQRTAQAPAGIATAGGTAFYQGNDVALYREPAAAGDSALVRFLEIQAPDTTLAISHIRRATRGAVTLANTQPCARQLADRTHVFAHNGDLTGIERSGTVVFDRYLPLGTTDSEYAFCALLERISTLWGTSAALPSLDSRLEIVVRFAADLRGNRNLKPPFPPPATISAARQAVNRAVFAENSSRSMTIRPLNRPESPRSDAL